MGWPHTNCVCDLKSTSANVVCLVPGQALSKRWPDKHPAIAADDDRWQGSHAGRPHRQFIASQTCQTHTHLNPMLSLDFVKALRSYGCYFRAPPNWFEQVEKANRAVFDSRDLSSDSPDDLSSSPQLEICGRTILLAAKFRIPNGVLRARKELKGASQHLGNAK